MKCRRPSPPHCNGGAFQETNIDSVLRLLAADRSIHEIILSGGDPLMLSDVKLAGLAERLAEISHVCRLRIHTRMPVVIPRRVTAELVSLLRTVGGRAGSTEYEVPSTEFSAVDQETSPSSAPLDARSALRTPYSVLRTPGLTAIVVVHINHPAEIDADVARAFGRLIDAGVPLLSQSVLLRGVNDRADVLAELFERLVDLRVMPYYLHQLDAVAGAAHFEVSVAEGKELMAALRARLPGYAVPRYVRETPGENCKQMIL